MALITTFKKIAQSGPCADGRTIDPQWLRDMAETYDSAVYTARIWPEHMRWGNNYGKVESLEVKEEGGLVCLYAQLAPNAFYVWDNQFDQKLNFSIEVQENFAQSGKAYLVGLGITDSPASLGTDEMKFRAHVGGAGRIHIFSNVPAVALREPEPEKAPGWFTEFFKKFTPNPQQEDTMTPEQFAALSAKVDTLQSAVDGIKAQFAAATRGKAEGAPAPGSDAASTAGAEGGVFAAEIAAALAPALEGMRKLSAQVEEINQRFAAGKPGATAPASTGPASDAAPLL